jgi:hypothetical protein
MRSTAGDITSVAGGQTGASWLTAWMKHDADRVIEAFSRVGGHPKRGADRRYTGQTRAVRENGADKREARIKPGVDGSIRLTRVYGPVEDTLTMSRASLGTLDGSEGLLPALRAMLRDPPGWKDGVG